MNTIKKIFGIVVLALLWSLILAAVITGGGIFDPFYWKLVFL